MAVQTTSGELEIPEVVEQLKEKLREYPNIMFALFLGSHAKACQRASSDLDIALFFKQPLPGLDLLYLINELSDYTKKEVDLVVLNSASAFLRHQVMKHSWTGMIDKYCNSSRLSVVGLQFYVLINRELLPSI